jgi:uncharacterized protein
MVGRQKEIETLNKALASDRPELIAIFGRRRVGKTFLVRNFFTDQLDFEVVGLKDGTKEHQLRNFAYSMKDASGQDKYIEHAPKDWMDAFFQLKEFLETHKRKEKRKVIFIDELPWIATPKSDFLTGFSYFWNSYASKSNIIVVICGSATSWMKKRILDDKGGLHNRVTRTIGLQVFTLSETEFFLRSKDIKLDRYQILQLYMAMGGIPHYLNQVEGDQTAAQNIDKICFHPQGALRSEYKNLYRALFANPERYETIVSALSSKWKGLSRKELLEITGLKDGGSFTGILSDLEQSGFIASYIPLNKKKKDSLYRLIDNYSLFFLKFIKDLPRGEAGNWQSLSTTQSWKYWSGYAYENICFQHMDRIKAALGISAVHTTQYSYLVKPTEEQGGAQIDMLIDRRDNAISICEVKFYNDSYVLTRQEAEKIRKKKSIFQQNSGTTKQLFLVLITTFGLKANQHSLGLIDNAIDMDKLF